MTRLVLPGLPAPSALDARGRSAALAELAPVERRDLLTEWVLGFREGLADSMIPWAEWSGVPIGELLASPLGLRACVLGLQRGVVATHHELRRGLPWREELLADDSVKDADADEWVGGVLRASKYGAFLQDGPLLTLDSNHQSRWTPHEFLHRACGFFHRSDMSRWECYLGARLAELLPVVHWYGFDQVARLDELRFDRGEAAANPSAPRGDARWLEESPEAVRRRMEQTGECLRSGLTHAAMEFAAVERERTTGRQVVVKHPFLNAASDATAYVVGHEARLMDSRVARVLESVPRLGEERWDTVVGYQGHVESVLDRLLFEDLVLDMEAVQGPRKGRILWDALLRKTLVEEDVPGEAFDPSALFAVARSGLEGEVIDLQSAWETLGQAVDEDVLALGLPLSAEVEGSAPEQLVEGLESNGPATFAWLQDHDETGEGLRVFLEETLWTRAPLLRRMERSLEQTGDPVGAGVARIEQLLSSAVGDDAVERLSDSPEHGGFLVASRAFTALEGDWLALVHHAQVFGGGELDPADALEGLLVGRWFGEGALLPVPHAVLAQWRGLVEESVPVEHFLAALENALEANPAPEGWPMDAGEWLGELLEAGAVGCFISSAG